MSTESAPSATQVPARVTVLSGGVGGARFLQGLLRLIERTGSPTEVTVIANTADDLWLHGLKICPDLDTVMYTLGDGIDLDRGWGRRAETWHAKEELAAYGVEGDWFGLGDRDLATHLVRTQMIEAGFSLTEVTEALCRRWQPGVRLLPMTDDRVETHVAIVDPDTAEPRAVHFQEYWVRYHAEVETTGLAVIGLPESTPGPEVIETIESTDLLILPPSNPIVSIGTITGVPGVADAIRRTEAPVVGVSGIIGDNHVHGMARQLLTLREIEVSAAGVAEHYGSRGSGGLLDGWLVADSDSAAVARVEAAGLACRAVPLLMSDHDATADLAAAAIDLVDA